MCLAGDTATVELPLSLSVTREITRAVAATRQGHSGCTRNVRWCALYMRITVRVTHPNSTYRTFIFPPGVFRFRKMIVTNKVQTFWPFDLSFPQSSRCVGLLITTCRYTHNTCTNKPGQSTCRIQPLLPIPACRGICDPLKCTLVPMLDAKTDHGNVTRAFS